MSEYGSLVLNMLDRGMESRKRERVMEELVQGQEYATKLQLVLREPAAASRLSADELVRKILTSFTDTLSVLTVPVPGESSAGEVSTVSPAQGPGCSWGDRCDSSGESTRKSITTGATPGGRRGCYKRKKKSETWTKISPALDDGHTWRKYGQKQILNSNFPRSYFRCTRKHEQGCKATKQVQRLEKDPHLYHTTYIGHHTCNHILDAPPLISDATPSEPTHVVKAEPELDAALPPADDMSCLDNEFGNNNNNNNNNNIVWSDLGALGNGRGGLDHMDLVEALGFDDDHMEQCGIRLDDEFFLLGKLY